MPFSQDDRPLKINTPLGKDVLLIQQFSGEEGISRLFHFQCEVLAENKTDVAFDQLLGQKVSVSIRLPKGERIFNGMVNRVAQGGRDANVTRYHIELVPQLWLLTRRVQSRIFQHETVPDILKKVLKGIDQAVELQGAFPKRDYCVQYRESDFAFASRLMEEEGIFYFFKHTADGHKLVLANAPGSHADVPGDTKAIYEEVEGGNREEVRVHSWRKVQEIRAGKFTLWDHNFELPQRHLEVEKTIQDSVQVGKVAHKLKVGGNAELELYDFPGGYAEWFDGIDKGGGEQPAELENLFKENQRVVGIRMQQEAVGSLEIHGQSTCGQLMAGHKFALERHFNADGQYVLTGVQHSGNMPDYRSGQNGPLDYSNSFTCIPSALPFRPQRTTPEPLIHGTQTAIVVGPPGEIIFPDKYGRVKVQFHWDREGKKNADSSCWVRVSQSWGGANWGGMTIPHVGQEVIVSFEEGDPDRPLIVGRVYNAESMPPLELPANKTKSVVARDHGGNEIILEGQPGKQQMRLFSPTHQTTVTLGNSYRLFTESDKKEDVHGNHHEDIGGNASRKVGVDLFEVIVGKHKIEVGGDFLQFFAGASMRTYVGWLRTNIGGWKSEGILGAETKTIWGAKTETIKGSVFKSHVGREYKKESSGLTEKSPSLIEMVRDAKKNVNTAKEIIQAKRTVEVAGSNIQKIQEAIDEYQTLKVMAGSHEHKARQQKIEIASAHKLSAQESLTKAQKIVADAAEWKVKGPDIKLG